MPRCLSVLLYAACVALLAACAHPLPEVQAGSEPRQAVRISTASGWLTYRDSQRIIRKLGGPGDAGDFLAHHLQVEEAVAGTPLVAGNQVQLFSDGPSTYRAMEQAIAAARRFIHLESYIFEDDDVGNRMAELLMARRAAGVAVAVMVDDVGTIAVPRELFDRMRGAGIEVVAFNPVNPLAGRGTWSLNERSHRKILVVDGAVAFVGGINVSDVYSSRPVSGSSPGASGDRSNAPWRDTHISIRGPAVQAVERVFLEGWRSQNGPELGDIDFLPPQPRAGPHVVRILVNKPGAGDNHAIYLTLLSAINSAQRSIHITMAYFVPDPAFIEALCEAARRGVDVVLLLPGFSDFSMVVYAGRSHYEELLAAGVKIYERKDALLHAKTAVVDGVWSTAGSSNLDWRSFTLNHEINAVILGPGFGAQMEALFESDRRASVQVDYERWKRRPVSRRFKEFVSRLLERWM
ncbi:putative cardiolipin synthase YwiE [Pigmentiphaga humi]|uniref:Cardiolipin synthase n=1 Tax=Pigmentiphaga humi TaxID=2478468 RepID=A0A3P4B2C1_9BURK|nr:cardiolipin synthase [Pigmentiphaga humi]VCU69850.1 putative cardiolipin synthase YwiE [Pigmentiphaga humi]